MGKLDNLGLGGSVTDRQADTGGEKIDTTAQNEKEQDLQDKAEDAMENDEDISDNDIDADISGDDSEDESEEDDDEESDEDSDDDDLEDDDEDEESDDSDEDSDESDEDKEPDKKATEETQTGDTNLGYSKLKEIEANADLSDEAKEQSIMQTFLEIHKDTIPESARINFQKFIDSGNNNAFLLADDSLHKLVMEVRAYKDDLPLSERLSKAYKVVFSDKIAQAEQKKGAVKAEMRTQKVNKSISAPTRSSSGKSRKNSLSAEQRDVFKRMGVPIPKKYR